MSGVSLVLNTPDASPGVAPYRISDKAEHDTFQAVGTVTLDNPEPIRAMRWVLNSSSRTAAPPGEILKKVGMVCGLDRCGTGAPTAMPLGDGSFQEEFDYADVDGRPDGPYPMSLHVGTESDGWV